MARKTIHNAQTGEMTELTISDGEMEREKLGLPVTATDLEVQAERQRRDTQALAAIQAREQMADLAPDNLLQRIQALEAAVAQLQSGT